MASHYDEEELETEEEEEEEAPKRKRGSKKWKDPNKPKRPLSAYFIYSQANRARTKEENPDASFGDLARIMAKNFKALPDSETDLWKKKAEQDKERYLEEMKSYVPAEDPTGGGGGGKKKAKKDPNAPKRNMSAYFLFSIEERPKVKADMPELTFGDVAREISKRYRELSEDDRKIWEDKAAADKERYEREMEEYRG